MKFKSPQTSLIDNSTLILDIEYDESDHISTIDIPSWSDQSTVHSIDDKVSLVSAAIE
jgi:hypothetical protein